MKRIQSLKKHSLLLLAAGVIIGMSSCSKKSNTTGWSYNDSDNGGFSVADFNGQPTGPGLVLIEGGTFTMGSCGRRLL